MQRPLKQRGGGDVADWINATSGRDESQNPAVDVPLRQVFQALNAYATKDKNTIDQAHLKKEFYKQAQIAISALETKRKEADLAADAAKAFAALQKEIEKAAKIYSQFSKVSQFTAIAKSLSGGGDITPYMENGFVDFKDQADKIIEIGAQNQSIKLSENANGTMEASAEHDILKKPGTAVSIVKLLVAKGCGEPIVFHNGTLAQQLAAAQWLIGHGIQFLIGAPDSEVGFFTAFLSSLGSNSLMKAYAKISAEFAVMKGKNANPQDPLQVFKHLKALRNLPPNEKEEILVAYFRCLQPTHFNDLFGDLTSADDVQRAIRVGNEVQKNGLSLNNLAKQNMHIQPLPDKVKERLFANKMIKPANDPTEQALAGQLREQKIKQHLGEMDAYARAGNPREQAKSRTKLLEFMKKLSITQITELPRALADRVLGLLNIAKPQEKILIQKIVGAFAENALRTEKFDDLNALARATPVMKQSAITGELVNKSDAELLAMKTKANAAAPDELLDKLIGFYRAPNAFEDAAFVDADERAPSAQFLKHLTALKIQHNLTSAAPTAADLHDALQLVNAAGDRMKEEAMLEALNVVNTADPNKLRNLSAANLRDIRNALPADSNREKTKAALNLLFGNQLNAPIEAAKAREAAMPQGAGAGPEPAPLADDRWNNVLGLLNFPAPPDPLSISPELQKEWATQIVTRATAPETKFIFEHANTSSKMRAFIFEAVVAKYSQATADQLKTFIGGIDAAAKNAIFAEMRVDDEKTLEKLLDPTIVGNDTILTYATTAPAGLVVRIIGRPRTWDPVLNALHDAGTLPNIQAMAALFANVTLRDVMSRISKERDLLANIVNKIATPEEALNFVGAPTIIALDDANLIRRLNLLTPVNLLKLIPGLATHHKHEVLKHYFGTTNDRALLNAIVANSHEATLKHIFGNDGNGLTGVHNAKYLALTLVNIQEIAGVADFAPALKNIFNANADPTILNAIFNGMIPAATLPALTGLEGVVIKAKLDPTKLNAANHEIYLTILKDAGKFNDLFSALDPAADQALANEIITKADLPILQTIFGGNGERLLENTPAGVVLRDKLSVLSEPNFVKIVTPDQFAYNLWKLSIEFPIEFPHDRLTNFMNTLPPQTITHHFAEALQRGVGVLTPAIAEKFEALPNKLDVFIQLAVTNQHATLKQIFANSRDPIILNGIITAVPTHNLPHIFNPQGSALLAPANLEKMAILSDENKEKIYTAFPLLARSVREQIEEVLDEKVLRAEDYEMILSRFPLIDNAATLASYLEKLNAADKVLHPQQLKLQLARFITPDDVNVLADSLMRWHPTLHSLLTELSTEENPYFPALLSRLNDNQLAAYARELNNPANGQLITQTIGLAPEIRETLSLRLKLILRFQELEALLRIFASRADGNAWKASLEPAAAEAHIALVEPPAILPEAPAAVVEQPIAPSSIPPAGEHPVAEEQPLPLAPPPTQAEEIVPPPISAQEAEQPLPVAPPLAHMEEIAPPHISAQEIADEDIFDPIEPPHALEAKRDAPPSKEAKREALKEHWSNFRHIGKNNLPSKGKVTNEETLHSLLGSSSENKSKTTPLSQFINDGWDEVKDEATGEVKKVRVVGWSDKEVQDLSVPFLNAHQANLDLATLKRLAEVHANNVSADISKLVSQRIQTFDAKEIKATFSTPEEREVLYGSLNLEGALRLKELYPKEAEAIFVHVPDDFKSAFFEKMDLETKCEALKQFMETASSKKYAPQVVRLANSIIEERKLSWRAVFNTSTVKEVLQAVAIFAKGQDLTKVNTFLASTVENKKPKTPMPELRATTFPEYKKEGKPAVAPSDSDQIIPPLEASGDNEEPLARRPRNGRFGSDSD